MRLGVSSYAFPRAVASGRMGLDGLLRWALDHGADAVQLCENLPWPLDRPLPEGLTVETGCRGVGPHLLDHLRLAERSGSGFVRLVIDDGTDEPTPEEAAERLRPYAEAYYVAGVTLAIENHDRFPARVLRGVVEELGLGVVLDAANSLGCLEGLETVVAELGPFVVNLHAKDVRAVRKPEMLGFDVVGTPFGEGGIDWTWVLARLPRLRSVTLEQWTSLEEEEAWAEAGMGRLRTLLRKDRDLLVLGEPRRPEPLVLSTGAYSVELEPDGGWLRNLRRGGVELVRAVHGAARTSGWGTPQPKISNLRVERSHGEFRAGYVASVEPALPFRWRVEIHGQDDDLSVLFEGEALDDLETNRVGLCFLHALTFQYSTFGVRHANGVAVSVELEGHEVSPHQPFRNVRELDAPGLRVEFEGETFETEDQRNWTDASLKTYSRPLDWPKPYRLAKGERVVQRVWLRTSDADYEPQFESSGWPHPLLSIGVLGPSGAFPDLPVSHVAVPEGGGVRLVNRAGETLFQPDVFTPTNFTKQNRERPKWVKDAMFAMNPQVHAFDWRTIFESLEAVEDCAVTAMGWAERVHLGPVTLDPEDRDPRFASLAAAGWLLGLVNVAAECGSHGRLPSITFGRPERFRTPLGVTPAWHVLKDLHEFEGATVWPLVFPHPQDLTFMTLRKDGRERTLMANLTDRPNADPTAPAGLLRRMDETNVRLASLAPEAWRTFGRPFAGGELILPPHAYACIDAEAR